MTDNQLRRMAAAAAIIRKTIHSEFRLEMPGSREYGRGSMFIVHHPPGDPLREYCNYDCRDYAKIELLSGKLSEAGFYIEDCTGEYSGVYDVTG